MKINVSGKQIVQKHKNLLQITILAQTAKIYMFKTQIKKRNAQLNRYVQNISIISLTAIRVIIVQLSKYRIHPMKLFVRLNLFAQKHNSTQ